MNNSLSPEEVEKIRASGSNWPKEWAKKKAPEKPSRKKPNNDEFKLPELPSIPLPQINPENWQFPTFPIPGFPGEPNPARLI